MSKINIQIQIEVPDKPMNTRERDVNRLRQARLAAYQLMAVAALFEKHGFYKAAADQRVMAIRTLFDAIKPE